MLRILPRLTAATLLACSALPADADDAAALLEESRQRLANYPALTADLLIQAELPSGRCETTGRYTAGVFPRLRVETSAVLGPVTLRALDVCDGQVLWSVRELTPDGEQPDLRIARRDVERVRQELSVAEGRPEQVLAAEVSVGGLPGLLAGLEAAYDFEEVESPAGSRLLTGRRKDDAASGPPNVRVTLDAASMIPTRVLYVERRGGEWTAVLNLELRNVSAPSSLDESLFRFTPPREADIENRTDDALSAIRGK